jgi:hypothetical protein
MKTVDTISRRPGHGLPYVRLLNVTIAGAAEDSIGIFRAKY